MQIYITFGLYLLVILGIGLYAYRSTQNFDDYILGGRKMGSFVTAMSAGASDMSGWLLMGLPGAIFLSGLSEAWIVVGLTIGAYLNYRVVAGRLRIFTEKYSNALTLPEFFAQRFPRQKKALKIISSGLIFDHEIDSIQNVTVAAGFTREISENANKTAYYSNAYALGLAYNFVHTTYGLDFAHKDTKNQGGAGNKVKNNEVTAVIRQGLNEDWNVYAMYSYKTEKTLPVGSAYSKSTDRQFLVGTEYYVYNQGSLKVKPFIEWQATRTKYENTFDKDSGQQLDRSRDFKTVIGLRAYW